jgi:hypothetical protein
VVAVILHTLRESTTDSTILKKQALVSRCLNSRIKNFNEHYYNLIALASQNSLPNDSIPAYNTRCVQEIS